MSIVIENLAVWLILTTLAVAWWTRFWVDEELSKPWRRWILNTFGESSKITYMVHCIWCFGTWSSIGIVALAYWGRGQWWAEYPILAMATALVAPMLLTLPRLNYRIKIEHISNREGEPWR